ncbi:glycoside hydrolase family 31 protein [Paracerasibacillus soli]|uniref:Glycoside hydrolase family 31 protein n=1 Tax=Paracerasibacillus soli TaxID=480284 RepID=A0ABU5CV14_9BACI|nr:TIM-barrel domain-containing protein [Virgibacillus soli]MDY0410218.1 glycoside hydrolase family 31 protein [Virgibacillus soli]
MTPLLPRYTLGNWWSRYWKYTETEYKELFQRFQQEDVPFSLSVIDMDWHLVDIPAKYGSGWTGYTWNKELFPDPTRFLKWLQDQELRVTLNVHPADGVKAHEEMYVPMAKELGIDYTAEHPISFDITDRKFRDAYFKYLHRPEEERGVSFWWLDWQQGTTTKVAGLDPLWLLNHYHALDQVKQDKRPLILSRYAGIGSHRYPVGFSGDTIITWESLRFQPYFTSTATNVGYTWWSHDIGGHYKGYKDDELSLRWIQFGVFSPIMRLHSTNSPFNGKEPWRFQESIGTIMKQYLRLRHELIPYLYTMNWRTHQNNHPLVMPMYYEYPFENHAYDAPHQYFFGSELIVIPVTEKLDSDLQKAPVDVWLPEGRWIDFFSGRVYRGGKKLRIFRGLDTIPVFAKEGAIVPMAKHVPHSNSVDNPTALSVLVFPGKSNTFELYEDDGESFAYQTGKYAITKMQLDWENKQFVILPVEGDKSIIPENRELNISFKGFTNMNKIKVYINGQEVDFIDNYHSETNTCTVKVMNYDTQSSLVVKLPDEPLIQAFNKHEEATFDLLNKAQISFELKDELYQLMKQDKNKFDLLLELRSMEIDENLYDALLENLID